MTYSFTSGSLGKFEIAPGQTHVALNVVAAVQDTDVTVTFLGQGQQKSTSFTVVGGFPDDWQVEVPVGLLPSTYELILTFGTADYG